MNENESENVEYLTPYEKRAIDLLGMAFTVFEQRIVGDDPAMAALDVGHFQALIEYGQRLIMAQAASRAYPGQLRPLGETIEHDRSFLDELDAELA